MQISSATIREHYSDIFGKHTIADLIVCKLDDSLEILFASDGMLDLLGCRAEDLLGSSYSDLISGENKESVYQDLLASIKTGNVYTKERRLQLKNGQYLWIMERGGLVSLSGYGDILKLIITDISKQKETEENLRISEKRYELVMSFSDVSLFDYDMQTKLMTVTHIDEESYGIPKVMENMPDYVVDAGIVLPKSVDTFLDIYKRIFAGEPLSGGKVWTLNLSGEERFLELQLVTIFDHDGKPVRAIGVHKDITDKFLLQQEKAYNKAMAASLTFIYEANISTNKLVSVNEQWAAENGLEGVSSFSELIDLMRTKVVTPDYQELLMQKMDKNYIVESCLHGKKLLSFRFAKPNKGGELWYEKSINIVYDDIGEEYLIRCYIEDVSKEQRAVNEQRRYEAMISKSNDVYELNISRNQAISGHGDWKQLFGIEASSDYSRMIHEFAGRVIHPDDRDTFLKSFRRENLIREFRVGNMVHTCEYRISKYAQQWCWMRCTVHLFEDLDLGHIRGFAYVENIDIEKKKELELLYKSQHDMLSGLYNKVTTKEKIDDYLQGLGKNGSHALFIVDLDNFKDINDQFGHVFGDMIISEVSAKIKATFREADLAGRIGGDEFVILMKNIQQKSIATVKAKQICELIYTSYKKGDKKYYVSASVGVAYFGKHGYSFDELYHNADVAMYNSKEYGRNRFSVYSENMKFCNMSGSIPREKEILVRGRNFEDYIGAYIFKMLYDSADPNEAVESALEIIAKHYGFCRAYVFEDTVVGQRTRQTFEWCHDGIEALIEQMQDVSYKELGDLHELFGDDGLFLLEDIHSANLSLRKILDAQKVKSVVAVAMKQGGSMNGFVGFDNCSGSTVLEPDQIWDIINLGNILSVFISQMRNREKYERLNKLMISALNAVGSYLYVCNPNTYEILFTNRKVQDMVDNVKAGDLCYQVLCGRDTPCSGCLMDTLKCSEHNETSKEYYNELLGIWVKCSASWIEMDGVGQVCLVNCVDVSNYKKNQ